MLAVTGAHQYEAVVEAVHEAAPPGQGPFVDLMPAAGHQADSAPLQLSQDLRGLQSRLRVLHHPELRGKLASRRIDAVLREAEKLVAAGTKELLVISQDTSAYGVDMRHEPREWHGRQVRAHMTDLARELGGLRTPEGETPGCGCTTSTPIRTSMR